MGIFRFVVQDVWISFYTCAIPTDRFECLPNACPLNFQMFMHAYIKVDNEPVPVYQLTCCTLHMQICHSNHKQITLANDSFEDGVGRSHLSELLWQCFLQRHFHSWVDKSDLSNKSCKFTKCQGRKWPSIVAWAPSQLWHSHQMTLFNHHHPKINQFYSVN